MFNLYNGFFMAGAGEGENSHEYGNETVHEKDIHRGNGGGSGRIAR